MEQSEPNNPRAGHSLPQSNLGCFCVRLRHQSCILIVRSSTASDRPTSASRRAALGRQGKWTREDRAWAETRSREAGDRIQRWTTAPARMNWSVTSRSLGVSGAARRPSLSPVLPGLLVLHDQRTDLIEELPGFLDDGAGQ